MSKRHDIDSASGRVEPVNPSPRDANDIDDDAMAQMKRQQVIVPKKGTLATEVKNTVRETFFPDNPLRGFKRETPRNRLYMAIAYIFPVFHWGRGYTLLKLKDDIIAGLTIGSLCIPQDIGYAKLAGLPPIYGLCKCSSYGWPQ
jgi:high affinity sulfate transporter 1